MTKDSKILGPSKMPSDKEIQEIVDEFLMKIKPINNMRKYYKIFRIDTPTVEVCADREWKTYDLEQKCLIPDVEIYETEEEAEKYLNDYFDNFPERAKNEEYVILKCYKKEE